MSETDRGGCPKSPATGVRPGLQARATPTKSLRDCGRATQRRSSSSTPEGFRSRSPRIHPRAVVVDTRISNATAIILASPRGRNLAPRFEGEGPAPSRVRSRCQAREGTGSFPANDRARGRTKRQRSYEIRLIGLEPPVGGSTTCPRRFIRYLFGIYSVLIRRLFGGGFRMDTRILGFFGDPRPATRAQRGSRVRREGSGHCG